MGISTRGLGNLTESTKGKEVTNFHLICLDVVHQPSYQNAMLESILESKEWLVGDDGRIYESSVSAQNSLRENLSTIPKVDADIFLKEQLLGFFEKLRKG